MDDDLLEAARAIMRISLHAADQIGGVSVVQLRALTVLDREPQVNLAQLAEGMGVTVSTTSRLVDRLVAAGMVDRRRAEHSRREIALTLTDVGLATLDRYDELRLEGLNAVLDVLQEGEREQVIGAFGLFAAAANESTHLPATAGQA